jgi:uncharacterized protein
MSEATIRFYAELNTFLPVNKRFCSFPFSFSKRVSVKHALESLGIPHTEVDLIIVNGESVDFDYILCDKDLISIYPVFETIDIKPIVKVRPSPLRDTRFVLDTHLGKLAAYLRMLGFDSDYSNNRQDEELALISALDGRILLTRDTGLLKRKAVTHGYFVHEIYLRRQVVEVIKRFDLVGALQPFQRCLVCNELLHSVSPAVIKELVPAGVSGMYSEFYQCQNCRRIYWKGTHYQRMVKFIDDILMIDRNQADQAISPEP